MSRLHSLLLTVFAVWSGWAQLQANGTVDSLVRSIRSGLQARQADEQIAWTIDAVRLTERLDDDVIEQVQAEGAGRLATDALERQRDITHQLQPPAAPLKLFEAPAAPSTQEQSRVLEQVREWAMQYTANLPNYLCTKEVSRYTKRKDPALWQKEESLTWEVGYADRKDYQKLVAINDHPAQRKTTQGVMSAGEFGFYMGIIFQPEGETKFQWSRWSNLRGRPTQVFSFYVDQKHAEHGLFLPGNRRALTALRGFVYVDGGTHQITRIVYDADGIPSGFPILDDHTVVDYGDIEIGGEMFLLPVRSNLRMISKSQISRNVTQFRNYRKFTSEVKIEFEKK